MKLSDVCFEMHQGINTVADKVKYYECGTPILQSKNITNGILDLEDVRFVNENDYNKYKEKYIPHKGNILLSNIGTIGKSLLIEEEKNFLIAWNIFLIKVNESKINSKFLNFYFQYLDMSNYYNKYLTGGTVKFINKKTMENIEIPNISLVNQIEIANKLEKVQKMIDIRKKQIEELDKLIKSQFVEMFGNPILNNKNWSLYKWNDVLTIKNGKNQKKVEKQDGKYPIYGSGGIMSYATDYICNEDTVIIGRKGNINNPILVRTKFWNVDTAFGLEPNKDKLLVEYLYYFCNFYNFEKHNKAVTIPSLTKSDLLNIDIPIPDIELQNQFAEIVKVIDKQKFEIQKNLEEMQKLQESLMNKYFG